MPFCVTALRRAGQPVLLLEDQPLPETRVATAVALGPAHHRVASVEQLPFPLEVAREAVARVARRQRWIGDVRREPGAHVGAERLFGG